MRKNKRGVLITGCSGMLGEAVYKKFKNKWQVIATDIVINEPWLSFLDVRSLESVEKFCNKESPRYIIHLAAITDLEKCELRPREAYETNALGTLNVATVAKKFDIPLVYISSAGIFDGKSDSYTEKSQPRPINIYGQSKYFGEIIVRYWKKSIIIRPGWMMGGGPDKDKKFISKIIKDINNGQKELRAVTDKIGTPSYTYDVAENIEKLLSGSFYGTYNCSCKNSASRFEIASYLLKNLNIDKKIKLKGVSSQSFKKAFFAPRPRSECLDNKKIIKIGLVCRDWQVCLSDYLRRFSWLK